MRRVALGVMLCGFGAALVMPYGCGKKAPPVAPRLIPLTAVADLQGVLSSGSVFLTWSHSEQNASARGYVVLRAQSALSRPDCPECPLVFQKMDTVTLERSARKRQHSLTFQQDVTTGFRYTFSVRPIQASGAQGPDSNLVVIDFPVPEGRTP
jgi:hypothetical protein